MPAWIPDRLDPGRFGVCMGTGITPVDVGELVDPIRRGIGTDGAFDMGRFALARAESIFPLWLLQHLPNMAAAHISILHQAMGPNNTIVTACAAGTQAVGEAFRLIARGDADVMLAGGCDSRLDPHLMVAYTAMKAVSTSIRPPSEVSRPFDAERDGFVLGEGAAVIVLESYRRAKRRGATIYAEITGYGSSFDAFGITRPEPEGKGAALSMSAALREARIDPSEIDYINAHGTSTRLNDLMETVAVKRVFGHRASIDSDELAEVDDRPLDRRLRRRRSRRDGPVAPARRRSADHQPGDARPRLRSRLRSQHVARDAAGNRHLQQLRLRRPERVAGDDANLKLALRRKGVRSRIRKRGQEPNMCSRRRFGGTGKGVRSQIRA